MNRPATRLSNVADSRKHRLTTLLATTVTAAVLVLSSSASIAQTGDENPSWIEFGIPTLEESFPSTNTADGLLLDLPADYFAEVNFPPMLDLGVDEPPVLLAGLDPLATP
jgi:hypothetical protein